jgi:hypothetical protein|nr:MAG TPA: hypothetical protein [Bacteriophage sp.]
MSLVMAVVCTDGIVVSGDFRRTEYVLDKETNQYIQVGYTDNTHKLFRTKSNRIIAFTGKTTNKYGIDIEKQIKELANVTDDIKFSLIQQFNSLVDCMRDNNNALIEVGIENGQKTIIAWNPRDGLSYDVRDGVIGAIGGTEVIEKYQKEIEEKVKGKSVAKVAEILKEYNKLTSKENKEVSPECEIEIIT